MSIQPFAPEERLTRRLVNQRLAAIDQALPPVGGILLWSGAADAIPTGWALCDGENGTPDLRDRFIIGAGGAYQVGATGGEAAHTLTTAELPSHSHDFKFDDSKEANSDYVLPAYGICEMRQSSGSGYYSYVWGTAGGGTPKNKQPSTTISNAGSGTAHNNLPPYYALCFIMRLE